MLPPLHPPYSSLPLIPPSSPFYFNISISIQNHLQLSHILQALLSNPSDVLHPEQYQHFLIILLVIARLHPEQLPLLPCSIKNTLEKTLAGESVSYNETDGCGLWTNVIVLLNELFWLFYENRPDSPVTSSILSMGKGLLVMWLSCDKYSNHMTFIRQLLTCTCSLKLY